MKRLYIVKLEWQRKGKGETPLSEILNVIANTADDAVGAAIKRTRGDFAETPAFVRLAQVVESESIDIIVN